MIAFVEIQPIYINAVFEILSEVSIELWGLSLNDLRSIDPLSDLNDPGNYYRSHGGVFMVILDDDHVVGMGGILGGDDGICELKRIFLRKEFRGRGLGKGLVMKLLGFAADHGCEKARLEVATPDIQSQAIGLYTHLGFTEIPCYRTGSCSYAMEKDLF